MDSDKILFFASQYGILLQLARHLSTLDLFHLALTCRELYGHIRSSVSIFKHLKRVATCDGRGLKLRQDFGGLYALMPLEWEWQKGRPALPYHTYDEEFENHVWNIKCDAANALPCIKCEVNICEECRFVPRVRDMERWGSRRRPHLEPAYQSHDLIAHCAPCDDKVEKALPLRLSEFCDCDQYTRWICHPCKTKEKNKNMAWYRSSTKSDFWMSEEEAGEGLIMADHQCSLYVWCSCGVRAPKDANIRCAWCMRKHNKDTMYSEDAWKIPYFDDDTSGYPKISNDASGNQILCPDLGYKGMIGFLEPPDCASTPR